MENKGSRHALAFEEQSEKLVRSFSGCGISL
jgi:hypothetical protein